jgi:hypothetical protein
MVSEEVVILSWERLWRKEKFALGFAWNADISPKFRDK